MNRQQEGPKRRRRQGRRRERGDGERDGERDGEKDEERREEKVDQSWVWMYYGIGIGMILNKYQRIIINNDKNKNRGAMGCT